MFNKANSQWDEFVTISIPRKENRLFIILNSGNDTEIKVENNNELYSLQMGSVEYWYPQYLILSSKNKIENYNISFKSRYKNKYNPKPIIKSKILKTKKELSYYQSLSKVNEYWHFNTKESKNNALDLLGNLYTKKLDHDKSTEILIYKLSILVVMEQFNEVIKFTDSIDLKLINNWQDAIRIKWYIAYSYLNLGDFKQSISLLKPLIKQLQQKDELSISWQLMNAKIQAYYGLAQSLRYFFDDKNNPDGYENLNLALNTASEIGDYNLTSEILSLLGAFYLAKEDWIQAIATLDIAEKYSIKTDSDVRLVSIYNQKAIAYRRLNQLDKSLKYYRLAIQNLTNDEQGNTKANVYNNIASIYEFLGNQELALRYFNNSYTQYTEMKSFHGMAMASKSIGRIERNKGNYNKAIQLHTESRDIFIDKTDALYIETITELSIDYYFLSDYGNSEKLAFYVLLLSNSNKIDTKHVLKKILDSNNEMSNKIKFLYKISNAELYNYYQYIDSNFNSKFEKKALKILARIALNNNELKKVNTFLVQIEKDSGFDNLQLNHQLDFYNLKIDYYTAINDFKNINQTAYKAIELINSTRAKFDVSDLALYWSNQAKLILNKFIDALILQDKHQQIFELLEKYYAINLREKRYNTTDETIKEKSKEIQLALDSYITLERETLLTEDKDKQNQADEAKEHFLALNATDIKPRKKIELDYLSIKQVQDNLREKELFVRYYLNDNNALAFIIDKHSWKVLDLPANAILKENVKTVLNNIKSKSFRKLKANDALLTDILPLNLISNQKYEKLIIIPDGVLNLLPFGTINISQDEGQYQPLASNLIIERAYSASDYFTSIELPQQNTHSISIFANPVFLNQVNNDEIMTQFDKNNRLWEFTALPYTKTDAEEIVSIFPDYEINLLTGNKATNENFMAAENRNANIIHIATHGFFNESNIEDVGIATSIVDENNQLSAGVLAMREVLFKPFTSNLVVISGCETTLGKEINGEGFNSLSRGLLSQGVGSVIGTIWSISDRATPEFMQTFYTNLKQEQGNVPLALKLTKQSFITDSRFRRYRHPYYWAGFVLTSSNRSISENIF